MNSNDRMPPRDLWSGLNAGAVNPPRVWKKPESKDKALYALRDAVDEALVESAREEAAPHLVNPAPRFAAPAMRFEPQDIGSILNEQRNQSRQRRNAALNPAGTRSGLVPLLAQNPAQRQARRFDDASFPLVAGFVHDRS